MWAAWRTATPEAEGNVRRLYELAGQTTHGFESYAKRLAKRYRRCPQLLEDVLEGLFHIAASDGAVSDHELDYLEQVARLFGMPARPARRGPGLLDRGHRPGRQAGQG